MEQALYQTLQTWRALDPLQRRLHFWRDRPGHEVDFILEQNGKLVALEIKSGSTFATDWTDGVRKWQKFTGGTPTLKPILIYGGTDSHEREHCLLTGWESIAGH